MAEPKPLGRAGAVADDGGDDAESDATPPSSHPPFILPDGYIISIVCIRHNLLSISFVDRHVCKVLSLAIVNKHLSQQIQKLAQPKRTNLTMPLTVMWPYCV